MGSTLASIAEALPGPTTVLGGEATIDDVTHDSRGVTAGSLFVAIPGDRFDGHSFIDSAIEDGAAALLVDRDADDHIPRIVTPDTRRAMAWAAREVHGQPDASLSILGVTGTNGKTTVAHLCESVWQHAGTRCAIIGTLGAHIDGAPLPLKRTTPESSDLQRLLGLMRDSNVHSVAMEVSSHALTLHRADAIRFTAVGFTNLTQDHLDFHGSMAEYLDSKRRLFSLDRSDKAVINIDDPAGSRIASETELDVVAVGLDYDAAIRATNVAGTATGTRFVLDTPEGRADVDLPLAGRFNVDNALVAAGLLRCDGVDLEHIAAGLSSVPAIPGRMEAIPHSGPFTVVIDYAHTPDAVSAVLRSAASTAQGRVIALVGAAGDRDPEKRSLMGAAASRFADVTIVTTDNPRSEDPVLIAEEVRRGALSHSRSTVEMIIDRAEAIHEGISMAEDGDVVLILGKGHEQGQEVHGVVHPFDDRQVAAAVLADEGWGPT
ncbi:MAG: UDP-N-acetylmuramoyl-L-alanyl-D-glutamate--2,6-diaminopimelate ligase [Acidimicrobiia bacterium]